MKCDKLIQDYCFDATDNQTKAVYPKADVDAAIDELKDELNRAKAREDVLVTDNRDLLEKVKMLEERLRENAEHFKRNEAQILENSDKVIAELEQKNDDFRYNIAVLRKEKSHQKYKRCLAMARWCFTKSNYHFILERHGEDAKENNRRSVLYSKWHKRWLKLAEKFKEAK